MDWKADQKKSTHYAERPSVILPMWLCLCQPHPSSLDPNRRKAFGVPGGDAVEGGAQNGKLKFECVGPMHYQSVKQPCLRQAFLGLRLGEPRKTRWNLLWTGKRTVSSWVAALAFLPEQIWVMRLLPISLLSLSDLQDLPGWRADLFLWFCLIFCSDLSFSLSLSFIFKRAFMTMYWLVLKFVLQVITSLW